MNGFSKLLQQEHAATLEPGAKDYLRRIADGAERMSVTIEALLNGANYAALQNAEVPLEFVVCGEPDSGNRSSVSPEILADWERQGNLLFLGHVEDIRPEMASADLVVLPSYREGAPRSLIEAAGQSEGKRWRGHRRQRNSREAGSLSPASGCASPAPDCTRRPRYGFGR